MTIRDRIEAFWSGEKPDRIPYTIYYNEWRHTKDDPRWEPMYRKGLGVTSGFGTSSQTTKDVEHREETWEENGISWRAQIIATPVGELRQTWQNGWHSGYLLKSREDYQVMTWIARNTVVNPAPGGYERCLAQVRELMGEWHESAVVHSSIGRTPLQTILVDYAGLENFAYHLCDIPDAVEELYGAMRPAFKRRVECAAGGPRQYVSSLENFTAESLGPALYGKYLLPVYEECFPILHSAGKIVGTHYDGRTASCKELIASAPIDLIESLTEPTEGDQTLAEARAAWPDKRFWSNIRIGDYQLPAEDLTEQVHRMIEEGSVDGRLLAFEVSEQYPANWYDSMPVVLDAINDHTG